MTAAKMVLHDWQRGKIPFFVPPPCQKDEESEGPNVDSKDEDAETDNNQASAAFRAIANVISSQQQMSVPVQRDLFSEAELKGETAEQLPATESDSDHQLPKIES